MSTADLVRVTQGLTGAAFQQARDGEIARIEKACGEGDAHAYCEVVSLYSGGKYALHTYRTYDDVRLVLGPETAAGSFGGDPDNFNFPRYAFDVALIRLYEDGKPADTPQPVRLAVDAARRTASCCSSRAIPARPAGCGRRAPPAFCSTPISPTRW